MVDPDRSEADYRTAFFTLLIRLLVDGFDPHYAESYGPEPGSREEDLLAEIRALTGRPGLRLVDEYRGDPSVARREGRGWPAMALTMLGEVRLRALVDAADEVLNGDVEGDVVQCGVWRGGSALLLAYAFAHTSGRTLWLADSFEGVPPPDAESFPADAGDTRWKRTALRVSEERVRALFAAHDLLDERVRLVPGWFRDTLPTLPAESIALLHVDGDLYESTMVALDALYDRIRPGGIVIVDDYGGIEGCRRAVDEFRSARSVVEPLQQIDWTAVRWRKSR